jgi:peroxiredoxin
MMKSIVVFASILTSATLIFADAEVGKPAPDFTGRDINGKTHRLSDYRGKIVILEAYNLDCPFCANHFKTGAMQELQKDLTSQGVIWLLINSSNPKSSSYRTPAEARKEFAREKMHATAWIDDSSGAIGKAYGLKTTPHMIVIDPKGMVVYDGAIDNRPETSGDPRQARNYVREAFAAVKAGRPVLVSRTKSYGCGIKYGY